MVQTLKVRSHVALAVQCTQEITASAGMLQGSILNCIPDPTVMHCLHIALAVEQRQADLKLLEAPDIGTGVGGKPKVLVPKAVDADEEEDDDDDNASESSDDEVSCVLGVYSQECVCTCFYM